MLLELAAAENDKQTIYSNIIITTATAEQDTFLFSTRTCAGSHQLSLHIVVRIELRQTSPNKLNTSENVKTTSLKANAVQGSQTCTCKYITNNKDQQVI